MISESILKPHNLSRELTRHKAITFVGTSSCIHICTSRSLFRKLAETLFRGRGAMEKGRKWLLCVKASVSKLGGAAWACEIPFLAFTYSTVNIYNALIKSSLLYSSATWRLTENNKRRVEAIEMDALRRSSRISRKEIIRNVTIRQQIGLQEPIIKEIEQN